MIDRYTRQHGLFPHDDDAAEMIDAERRAAIYELEFHLAALSDEIAEGRRESISSSLLSANRDPRDLRS